MSAPSSRTRTPTWPSSTSRARPALGPETLPHRHAQSPWARRTLRGRVVRTLARGTTVFADGRVAGPPAGRLVPRETTEES
jgi:hypothetical protein